MLFQHSTHPARRRFLIAIPLGLLAGLICVAFAAQTNPEVWNLKSMLFWTLVSDRFLIGLVVGLVGAFTQHPVFGFRCYPFLRGAIMGAVVGMGAVYGLVIDLIATKFGGEGKALI